jgi:hypothetical protein
MNGCGVFSELLTQFAKLWGVVFLLYEDIHISVRMAASTKCRSAYLGQNLKKAIRQKRHFLKISNF